MRAFQDVRTVLADELGVEPSADLRRVRERGRTPLFDQYEDGDRPRAANE
ncbi:BTAD domain-containing putative transcriptional regulator [Streptomyces eurythermus]